MHIPKKYFQDRTVLILLTVNSFFTLLNVLIVLLIGLTSNSILHLVELRPSLGYSSHVYSTSTLYYLYFLFFALFTFGIHTYLSIRTYDVRRHFSILLLSLTTLLLSLSIIVSYSLMTARP